MKRKKLAFTWELLDILLKLNGAVIYNVKITDDGLLFDVKGKEMEHVEGAMNYTERNDLINWKKEEKK